MGATARSHHAASVAKLQSSGNRYCKPRTALDLHLRVLWRMGSGISFCNKQCVGRAGPLHGISRQL
jgi:hypothetical protein